MQSKTTIKFAMSILLVAAILCTYCFGCNFSFAFAETSPSADSFTVTYKYSVDGSDYNVYSTVNGVFYGKTLIHPTLEPVKWFRVDAWYQDEARTEKAPDAVTQNQSMVLYGAYVFDIGKGDVNGDGSITTSDSTIFRQYLVGGYGICTIPAGSEWAYLHGTANDADGNPYDPTAANPVYFLERVADLYGSTDDGSLDIRDVAEISMALAGGYGLDIYENQGTTGSEIDSGVDKPNVYFFNSGSWNQVYAYVNGNADGCVMTPVAEHLGWYVLQCKSTPKTISFGNGSMRLPVMSFDTLTPYYNSITGLWQDKFPAAGEIYYQNANNWETVSIYTWKSSDDSIKNAGFPGETMTSIGNNWYKISLDPNAGYDKVIFNKGYGGYGNETGNLDLNLDDSYYSGWGHGYVSPLSSLVYFRPTTNWGNVYAYAWVGDGNSAVKNHDWPGLEMTACGNGWYALDVPNTFVNIIFNNNSGEGNGGNAAQTGDLVINRENPYYETCLSVDGVRHDLAPNASSAKDKEFEAYQVHLSAGQTVTCARFGRLSAFSSNGIAGVTEGSTTFTVAEDGYYDFYCDPDHTWVAKSPAYMLVYRSSGAVDYKPMSVADGKFVADNIYMESGEKALVFSGNDQIYSFTATATENRAVYDFSCGTTSNVTTHKSYLRVENGDSIVYYGMTSYDSDQDTVTVTLSAGSVITAYKNGEVRYCAWSGSNVEWKEGHSYRIKVNGTYTFWCKASADTWIAY